MKFAHIMDLIIEAREVMKSPEIFIILLLCPLLRFDDHVMNYVVPLAICIIDLNEKALETLSKQFMSLVFPLSCTGILILWAWGYCIFKDEELLFEVFTIVGLQ